MWEGSELTAENVKSLYGRRAMEKALSIKGMGNAGVGFEVAEVLVLDTFLPDTLSVMLENHFAYVPPQNQRKPKPHRLQRSLLPLALLALFAALASLAHRSQYAYLLGRDDVLAPPLVTINSGFVIESDGVRNPSPMTRPHQPQALTLTVPFTRPLLCALFARTQLPWAVGPGFDWDQDPAIMGNLDDAKRTEWGLDDMAHTISGYDPLTRREDFMISDYLVGTCVSTPSPTDSVTSWGFDPVSTEAYVSCHNSQMTPTDPTPPAGTPRA
jgi:hypothetical protein